MTNLVSQVGLVGQLTGWVTCLGDSQSMDLTG